MQLTTPSSRPASRPGHARRRVPPPRGVVALGVVLVLFLVVALVAAYANRGLIVEQRIAANSHRAERAQAAADAGLQWLLAQLNGGRIDDQCQPTMDLSKGDFRSRYLVVQPMQDALQFAGGQPACTLGHDGSGASLLQCTCPGVGTRQTPLAVAAPGGAFRVDLAAGAVAASAAQPVEVRGCGSVGQGSSSCAEAVADPRVDGLVAAQASVARTPILPQPPIAALTVVRTLNLPAGATFQLINADSATAVTLHTGASVIPPGQPGSPFSAGSLFRLTPTTFGDGIVAADPALAALATPTAGVFGDALLLKLLGVDRRTLLDLPGVVKLKCPTGCTDRQLIEVQTAFPQRPIVVLGDLTIGGSGQALPGTSGIWGTPDVGPGTSGPLMLMVEGRLSLKTSATLHGFILARDVDWSIGGGRVAGAMVAENFTVVTGSVDIVYAAEILRAIRDYYGTFVQVPSSWRGAP